jgi:hypothetical protein
LIEMQHQHLAAVLFASALPTGSRPTGATLDAAADAALQAWGGPAGCVAVLAAAYGDYPETAATRMRWALSLAPGDVPHPVPDRALVAA